MNGTLHTCKLDCKLQKTQIKQNKTKKNKTKTKHVSKQARNQKHPEAVAQEIQKG